MSSYESDDADWDILNLRRDSVSRTIYRSEAERTWMERENRRMMESVSPQSGNSPRSPESPLFAAPIVSGADYKDTSSMLLPNGVVWDRPLDTAEGKGVNVGTSNRSTNTRVYKRFSTDNPLIGASRVVYATKSGEIESWDSDCSTSDESFGDSAVSPRQSTSKLAHRRIRSSEYQGVAKEALPAGEAKITVATRATAVRASFSRTTSMAVRDLSQIASDSESATEGESTMPHNSNTSSVVEVESKRASYSASRGTVRRISCESAEKAFVVHDHSVSDAETFVSRSEFESTMPSVRLHQSPRERSPMVSGITIVSVSNGYVTADGTADSVRQTRRPSGFKASKSSPTVPSSITSSASSGHKASSKSRSPSSSASSSTASTKESERNHRASGSSNTHSNHQLSSSNFNSTLMSQTSKRGTTYEIRRPKSTPNSSGNTSDESNDSTSDINNNGILVSQDDAASANSMTLTGSNSAQAISRPTSPSSIVTAVLRDGKESLVAGTVEQFVEHYIYHIQDATSIRQFILARATIASPALVLSILTSLFSSAAALETASERTQMQIRIIGFMKKWIHIAPEEFESRGARVNFNRFLDQLKMSPETEAWSKLLNDCLEMALETEKRCRAIVRGKLAHQDLVAVHVSSSVLKLETMLRQSSMPEVTKPWRQLDLFDMTAEEFARQWTLRDMRKMSRVPLAELLDKRWEHAAESPHVAKANIHFNRSAQLAGSLVIKEYTPKKRAKVLSFLIHAADFMVQNRNFFGAMAIIIGLSQSPISRLRLTWDKVSSGTLEKWKYLENVGSPVGNFKLIRAMQERQTHLPIILAPTMLFRDLLFIEDGNQDYYDVEQAQINFEKVMLYGKVLELVHHSRTTAYPYKHILVIQKFISSLSSLEEEEMMRVSRTLEP